MATILITPETFKQYTSNTFKQKTEEPPKKKLRQISVSSFGKVLKEARIEKEEEFKIEWTSPGYSKVEVLWGLYSIEKGERKTFIIRGKKGFCQTVLKELSEKGSIKYFDEFLSKPVSSAIVSTKMKTVNSAPLKSMIPSETVKGFIKRSTQIQAILGSSHHQ